MSRDEIIDLIMLMRSLDIDYARAVLRREHERMPWLGLMAAVRERVAPEAPKVEAVKC